MSKPTVPALVADRFEIERAIGSGSYSEVHLGTDRVSKEQVAVKFEWQHAEKGRRLLYEAELYDSLAGSGDVPRIRWRGVEGEYNIMVMDLLGPSLEDLFRACGRRFSLKTVLMLGEQMIDRLEFVHSRGIVHRDIKPHNFLMGLGDRNRHVHIMDFGLAKRYCDPESGEHIPCAKKKGLTGTVRYTSRHVHRGTEPSRRDDLGSVGYVLMHFNLGRLPWQGIDARSKRVKQRRIGKRKEATSHEELCKGFPSEFITYLKYCEGLDFAQEPDYNHLRQLLRQVLLCQALESDLRFDWIAPDGSYLPPENTRHALRGAEDEVRPPLAKQRKVCKEPAAATQLGPVSELAKIEGHDEEDEYLTYTYSDDDLEEEEEEEDSWDEEEEDEEEIAREEALAAREGQEEERRMRAQLKGGKPEDGSWGSWIDE